MQVNRVCTVNEQICKRKQAWNTCEFSNWLNSMILKDKSSEKRHSCMLLYILIRIIINLSYHLLVIFRWFSNFSSEFHEHRHISIKPTRREYISYCCFHSFCFWCNLYQKYYLLFFKSRTLNGIWEYFLCIMHQKQKYQKQQYEIYSILVGSIPRWQDLYPSHVIEKNDWKIIQNSIKLDMRNSSAPVSDQRM